ncbi:MAG: hypothetical protein PVI91_17205 [Gammaproteobacteria bacterium]
MQIPQTRRKPAPMHRSLARRFPHTINRMMLMLAVAVVAVLALSTMATAAPLRLAQATAEGQQEAMPAMTSGGAESAAEGQAAHRPASEEGTETGPGESEAPKGESTGMMGRGMMGRGMMSGRQGMGMMGMHGGKKACAKKHGGHKYYKYYKRIKKQLDRIEKRQILIETMLREQMLGGE